MVGQFVVEVEPDGRTFPVKGVDVIAHHGIAVIVSYRLPAEIGTGSGAFKGADPPVSLAGLKSPVVESEISLVEALVEGHRETAMDRNISRIPKHERSVGLPREAIYAEVIFRPYAVPVLPRVDVHVVVFERVGAVEGVNIAVSSKNIIPGQGAPGDRVIRFLPGEMGGTFQGIYSQVFRGI